MLNPEDLPAYIAAIEDYTARQLARSPEELRAELEAEWREIEDGWLGMREADNG